MCVGKLSFPLYPFKFTASKAFLGTETDLFRLKGTVFCLFRPKGTVVFLWKVGEPLKGFVSGVSTGFSGVLSTGIILFRVKSAQHQ